MARVTPDEVANIFDTDLDTSDGGSLDTWIDIANELVDDIQDVGPSISDARLEKIELLAAAHLASAQDQRIDSASRETASVNYQGKTGMDWKATTYGQRAVALDPTGTLADSGKRTAFLSVPDTKGVDR